LLGYCWAKAEPETTSAAPSAAMRMNLCISAPSGCVLFPLVVLILDLVRSDGQELTPTVAKYAHFAFFKR
jgi:hypothetical protein